MEVEFESTKVTTGYRSLANMQHLVAQDSSSAIVILLFSARMRVYISILLN